MNMAVYLTNDIDFDRKEIFISIPELEAVVGNMAVDVVVKTVAAAEDMAVKTEHPSKMILLLLNTLI